MRATPSNRSGAAEPLLGPGRTFDVDVKLVVNVSSTTGMDEAFAVVVRPADGFITAAGYATVSGNVQFAAARFNVDGTPDNGFGVNGRAYVDFTDEVDYAQALVIQPLDDKLVLGGRTLYSEPCCGGATTGSYDFLLARLNPDGSLDDGSPSDTTAGDQFGPNGKVLTDFGSYCGQGIYDSDYSLVLQPDGKIVAAGDTYDAVYGGRNFAIARYLPDGALDTTFAGTGTLASDFRGTDDTAYAVTLQDVAGATKILAAGYSRGPATTETRKDFALMRYNDNGSLDTTFGAGGKVWSDFGGIDPEDEIRALAIDSTTGKIIAAGHADKRFAVARYLPSNKVQVVIPEQPYDVRGLAAGAASTTQINLEWGEGEEPSTKFDVYRGTAPDFVASTASRVAAGLTVSAYINTVPTPGVYYYVVTAVRGLVPSAESRVGPVDTTQVAMPDAPDLSARGETGKIDLTWIDFAVNETGYQLERSADQGVTWPATWTLGTNVSSYSDTTALSNVEYLYRARASNAAGNSIYSESQIAALPEAWGMQAYLPGVAGLEETSLADVKEETRGVTMAANYYGEATSLIRVVLTRYSSTEDHTLVRSSADINIWADALGTIPILGPGTPDEVPITFAAATRTVFVELKAGGARDNFGKVRAKAGGFTVAEDIVRFKRSQVIVNLISGHTQNGDRDRKEDPNKATKGDEPALSSGMYELAKKLRENGFTTIRLYSEDPGNTERMNLGQPAFSVTNRCGGGQPEGDNFVGSQGMHIFSETKKTVDGANNAGDPMSVALIGYSHGAGLAYLVAAQLGWEAIINQSFVYRLSFTGYIDAVQHPNDLDWVEPLALTPERRVPFFTEYHVNYFQKIPKNAFEPFGDSMQPQNQAEEQVIKMDTNFDAQGDNINHSGMDDNLDIRFGKKDVGPDGVPNFRGIVPSMILAHPDE